MYRTNSLGHPAEAPDEEGTIPVLAQWFGSWQLSLRRRALTPEELIRSYDRAAPGWSRALERLGFPRAYEGVFRRLLGERALNAEAGERPRVLDCGVGTGALSDALARVSPVPFRLDAIDISPRMLERAAARLGDSGVAACLRQGDVRRLPYEDGRFDLVMSAHVLEHLSDPDMALGEMLRVLKPGGLFVVCLTRRSLLGAYINLRWRTHRVTPGEAEAWLQARGLREVHRLSLGDHAFCRRLSVACVGRKPL